MLMPPEQGKALFQAEMPEETVTRYVSFGVALFHVVFGCRPDRGRDTCRNSANASIVSQRLHCQRRFYLRPKFRQLQRLLGRAYPQERNSKMRQRGVHVVPCSRVLCPVPPEFIR